MKRILHLFAVILTSFLLYGCDDSGNEMPQPEVPKMQDGVFEGHGEGRSGMIKVAIIVMDHIITAINILCQSESKFAQPAEQQIIDAVLE